jgi:RNA polymerase sigma-70 factor (ECF subfamily)
MAFGGVGDVTDDAQHPAERLRDALRSHYSDVWRVVRRLGVPESSAEDAAQAVFLVAASKLDDIPVGKERAFLLGTAARVAANHRRSAAARYELADDEVARERADERPAADALLEEKRLREHLDQVLSGLPDDLRTVLVLFELEEMGLSEIATALGIPRGTAASRLRRAREAFEGAARRLRARLAAGENVP